MANSLGTNPIRVDTAATVIADPTGETLVQVMEWVDDDGAAGGVLVAGDNLIMSINGVPVQLNVPVLKSDPWNRQFLIPFRVFSLVVSTISGGTLLIWKA